MCISKYPLKFKVNYILSYKLAINSYQFIFDDVS